MFKQRTLYIWLFLWSDLCTNGQDFVRDYKARHGIKRIRWFGYFMVTSVLNTPSVYIDHKTSRYLFMMMTLCLSSYIQRTVCYNCINTRTRNIQCVHETTKKNTSITSPHTERKQEKLISLDFILVAWKTEQGFTWGYLL